MHPTGEKMSLQNLNTDYQKELMPEENPKKTFKNPVKGVFSRLRTNKVGSILRGEYPTPRRLEELMPHVE